MKEEKEKVLEVQNCIVKIVLHDVKNTLDYYECGSWDFAHNSKMLMLNSVNETPEAKRPRMGLDMNKILYFHDITDDKVELRKMEVIKGKTPRQII